MLEVGTRLQDRYEVLQIVRAGGMGVIYLAADALSHRQVVLKELISRAYGAEELEKARVQFFREGQILAGLSHEGLPRVYDFFERHDQYYLVMEYIPGINLEDLLVQRGGALPTSHVVYYGIEIAAILDYLHTCDPPVIFRDMKPSNVMVQEGGTVKLIDFGLSKRQHASLATAAFVKGTGTLGYSPPEQYAAEGMRTDARSDIYALGATLYTLLNAKIPPASADRMINSLPLTFRHARDSRADIELEHVIRKMMELKQEDRYSTAQEVLVALWAVNESLGDAQMHRPASVQAPAPPPQAHCVPMGPAPTSPPQAHRAPVGPAPLAHPCPAPPAPPPPSWADSSHGQRRWWLAMLACLLLGVLLGGIWGIAGRHLATRGTPSPAASATAHPTVAPSSAP